MTQPKNLSQLKKACVEGVKVGIVNHRRPELSRNTVVTRNHTLNLVTRAMDKNGKLHEYAYLLWGKAGEWAFDDAGAHLTRDGEAVVSITVLDHDEEIDENLRRETYGANT